MPASRKWDLNTLLGLVAVVTSVCALSITFYQAYLQRTQQYASVMPVLDNFLNNGPKEDTTYIYELVIVNNGIGPAFVKNYEYWFRGRKVEEMKTIVETIRDDTTVNDDQTKMTFSGLWNGRVISQNQEIKLVSLLDLPNQKGDVADNQLARRVDEIDGKIRVKIWYESIYGERWLFDTRPNRIEDRLIKIE